jgi:hypothetical protein
MRKKTIGPPPMKDAAGDGSLGAGKPPWMKPKRGAKKTMPKGGQC